MTVTSAQAGSERRYQVPADVFRSVELMAKVGSCDSPSFSPDGEQIAFLSDLSGVPQVWIVPCAGGWPQKVTAFDDPVQAVSWSPEGSLLAVAVAPGGGMNTQIYVVRPDGSDLRLLTEGGKDNNWLGPWTHDGRFLALSSSRCRWSRRSKWCRASRSAACRWSTCCSRMRGTAS